MNNKQFARKVVYVLAIALLLLPLYMLGQPSTKQPDGKMGSGGVLADIRHRYRIGQADIGQIDPASESMRLATLGMRGIAAAWLWQKAEYYKEEQYFDRLAATLNQIALLQPHFIKVWESQAHNLAYNVSYEFDDYRQRYAWVKKGIDYLIKGTAYNEREPNLQWFLGKYMTQKLGHSDEQVQFRELYRNDDDYHEHLIASGLTTLKSEALGIDRKPDNWLSGRLWFLKAYDLVDAGAMIKKSEVLFYAEAPWAQMYFSEAIEGEGVLDDRARFAWSRASESWKEFGNRDILTTWGDRVQLRSLNRQNQQLSEEIDKFTEMTEGVRQKILDANRGIMTDGEKYVIDTPDSELDETQLSFKQRTLDKYLSNRFEVARQLPVDQMADATNVASRIQSMKDKIDHTDAYRNLCNYNYWEMRSEAEQSPVTLAARQQIYAGDQFIDRADLAAATKQYEKAWLNWNAVFRRYPAMMLEPIADEVLAAITRYMSATDTREDGSFILQFFVDFRNAHNKRHVAVKDNDEYRQLDRESVLWESALDEPALVDNEIIPMPDGWTSPTSAPGETADVAAVSKVTKPAEPKTDVAPEVVQENMPPVEATADSSDTATDNVPPAEAIAPDATQSDATALEADTSESEDDVSESEMPRLEPATSPGN